MDRNETERAAALREWLASMRSEPEFLLRIAPAVPEALLPDALAAAATIRDPLLRIRTSAALAARLPSEAERRYTVDLLVKEALAMRHATIRDAALRAIAGTLARQGHTEALNVADAIGHPYRHAQALGDVAGALAGADITAALDVASRIPFESVETPVFERLALACAQAGDLSQARSMLERASYLAPTIHHPRRRAAAMRRVGQLEERLFGAAGPPAPGSLTVGGRRAATTHRAARALTALPQALRDELLREAIQSLRPRMAMANGGGSQGSKVSDEHTAAAAPEPGAPAPRRRAPRARNVVNTGFALVDSPRTSLGRQMSLSEGESYYFWLDVGQLREESIETEPRPPAEHLPAGARLTVALFGFPGELEITPGADVGELELREDGSAKVVRQPTRVATDHVPDRLHFPVRAPERTGVFRLRCNIYHQRVLLQSRLVRARVTPQPRLLARPALRSDLDYVLCRTLQPAALVRLTQPHQLSLMLNDNGNGAVGFRFIGAENFKSDASLDGQALQNLIDSARSGLRLVAWGSDQPWDGTQTSVYRYRQSPGASEALADLARLAIRGYRVYDALINTLAGGQDEVDRLAELMLRPGMIQVALKHSPRFIFPAGLMYDYPLDTTAFGTDLDGYALCPTFRAATNGVAPLEDCVCFQGGCPTRGTLTAICPSGFWGFRHQIGFPVTVGKAEEATAEIERDGSLDMLVGISTDAGFTLRQAHLDALRALRPDLSWHLADTRQGVLDMLRQMPAEMVYFYCHGGVTATKLPFIEVGDPQQNNAITGDNLRAYRIRWTRPRPLVFINGCHTTALEPEAAIDFVSALIEVSGAAGVVGTEITVFEPLAGPFALECLRRFMDGATVGEAIRGARLWLLKQGNPLGLVYVPYAMANLRLVS